MSVNTFVHNRRGITSGASTPPPQSYEANSEAIYHDRAFAKDFKMPVKKTSSASVFGQQRSSYTAQAPSQSSNTRRGSRFANGILPQSQQAGRGHIGLPDTDVESNFDETLTSIHGQLEPENGQINYGNHENDLQDQDYQADDSLEEHYKQEHHKHDQPRRDQSVSPFKPRLSVPVTSGQYTVGHSRQYSDIPVPLKQNTGRNTKKRGRTEEPHQVQKKDVQSDVNTFEHDEIGEFLPVEGRFTQSEEEGERENDGSENNNFKLGANRRQATPPRYLEESAEHSPEEDEYRDIKIPINADSSTHSLDFPEHELRKMEYSKLSTEPWELSREAFTLPDNLKGATLDQQVDHYALNKEKGHWATQVEFYQSLNSKQWDEAGDHLLAQIGNLFQQIKDAKKQKRKVLEEIEAEIEAREESVRGKSANIDAKFVAMQAGGEGLLKGRN